MTKNRWLTKALTNQSSFKSYLEPLAQLVRPKWQANGFNAVVIENRVESEQVFSLIIRPQRKWPGFIAGQHLDLQVEIAGVRYLRTFSLSCAPKYQQQTGLIELTIRQQEQGKVTPFLANNIAAGDAINISAPRGQFTLPKNNQPLLFIAGGSGVTPFRSFIQELSLSEPQRDVHLIYYNQATKPLFALEWPLLMNTMPHLKVTMIDTAQKGLINEQQLLDHCKDLEKRVAYLCGPHGLITTSREILLQLGVAENNIHHELFGPKPIENFTIDNDAEVVFASSQTTVNTEKDHPQTLLELAEAAELNPTSGCRMGVCHQCKCRKKQGVVYNTLTEQFSDTGEEDIQLCVSVAAGDVTLDL
ncbi:FAD-binding oxidoreductase [Marinicella sp. S1101]|uniref:flavin reductase family protein n=1 Tax=Marinicella marina TaxID=2996016 RepID=UPI002260B488|nr:FAD-binding oxidoreductase [Marinicella marina]MCX7553846.1 FAD-binding oxidoreductase [Marinicella marina]MDJ1140922.1 FAD-binding oxidoreductase [Marinicella marina]